MELLIELARLQSCGVVLSFEPSMDVPLWKLKHEFQQHDAQQTLLQRVSMVKKGIKMSTLLLSTFAGKFLKLEGWSEYVHDELDTGTYDSALEQIYRTVAGRGRPNCWAQVIMLVVGTAIAYHIHNVTQEKGIASNGENIVFKMFSIAGKAMDILKPNTGSNGGGANGRRRPTPPPPPASRAGTAGTAVVGEDQRSDDPKDADGASAGGAAAASAPGDASPGAPATTRSRHIPKRGERTRMQSA